MKRLLPLLVILLLSTWSLRAQTTEPLLRRSTSGYNSGRFYLGEERISRRKMGQLLQRENPEAYHEFARARTNRELSILTGVPGGALVGYQGSKWLTGGRPNAVWGGLGLGLFIASYVFTQKEESHLERAVALHNQRAGRLRLGVGPTASGGLGLRMQF